jgi:hypothetical protein
MVEGIKSLIEHHTNLNKSVEHEQHSHLQNLLRTFQNKLVDLDIKFEFFYITAYDLLISTCLIIFVLSNSLIFNAVLINDTALKVVGLLWAIFKQIKMPLVYDTIYTVIQDFLKRDFLDAWKITSNFFNTEKLLITNLVLLGLLVANFLWTLAEKYSGGLSLGQVSDIAHDFKDKIEEKMHDLGVGITKEIQKMTGSKPKKEREGYSSEKENLKTMESEGGNNLDSKTEPLPNNKAQTQFNKRKRL